MKMLNYNFDNFMPTYMGFRDGELQFGSHKIFLTPPTNAICIDILDQMTNISTPIWIEIHHNLNWVGI